MIRTIGAQPDAGSSEIDRAADRIMEAVPKVMRSIRTEMRNHAVPRLTVPQMRTLLFVGRHPDASLVALGEHLGASPSTCSVLVNRLVRDGLLDRTPDPRERRRVRLRLTDDGVAVVASVREQTRRWLRARLGSLATDDLEDLVRALDLLESVTTAFATPGRVP